MDNNTLILIVPVDLAKSIFVGVVAWLLLQDVPQQQYGIFNPGTILTVTR